MSKGFSREWPALLRAHGVVDGTSGILDSAGPGGTGKVNSQMLNNMDVMARTSGIRAQCFDVAAWVARACRTIRRQEYGEHLGVALDDRDPERIRGVARVCGRRVREQMRPNTLPQNASRSADLATTAGVLPELAVPSDVCHTYL